MGRSTSYCPWSRSEASSGSTTGIPGAHLLPTPTSLPGSDHATLLGTSTAAAGFRSAPLSSAARQPGSGAESSWMIQYQATGPAASPSASPAGASVASSACAPRRDSRCERARQAGLLHLDRDPRTRHQEGVAAIRGSDIDADHVVDRALLAGEPGQGPGQPLGAVPAQDERRHVVDPGHHSLVGGWQEPVEGVVSAGVDVVDHHTLALTDRHESPR